MEYITSKCPYCHKVVNHTNSLTKYSEGCLLRTCPSCGRTYIDPNCEEPALRPYKPFGVVACVMTAAVGGIFVGFAVLILIFAVGYFSSSYSVNFFHVWISVIVGGAYCVFSFINRTAKLKKENAEKLQRWKESEERLLNPEYAKLLAKAGIKVPQKYLSR